jgi:enoyl-CoA hydratase/carnithine racemase
MTSPLTPPSLQIEFDGDVAVLRLNRPAKRNALDDATVLGLEQFFAKPPEGIKAAVLAAAGPHFSAGLDLAELTARDAFASVAHSRMWHRALATIESGSIPVVAALTGAVIGGGLELACAAHIRVADATAFYALPEGQRGLFVGGGGSVRLPRLIGAHRMADMMLTGRIYDGAGGQHIGISQYLTAEGDCFAKALELAGRIAENSPVTNFAVLQALPRIAQSGPDAGFLMESLIAGIAASSSEAQQRMQAFLDGKAAKVDATEARS